MGKEYTGENRLRDIFEYIAELIKAKIDEIYTNMSDYNLDNKFKKALPGMIDANSGQVVDVGGNVAVHTENYDRVKAGDTVTIITEKTWSYICVRCYDSNKNYIQMVAPEELVASDANNAQFIIPSNGTNFINVTMYSSAGGITPKTAGHIGVYINSTIDAITKSVSALKQNVTTTTGINGNVVSGYDYDSGIIQIQKATKLNDAVSMHNNAIDKGLNGVKKNKEKIEEVKTSLNDLQYNDTHGGVNVWNEQWEVGSLDNSTGADVTDATRIRSKGYTEVKPNTTYFLYGSESGVPSGNLYLCPMWFDANKVFISGGTFYNNRAITSPNNAKYLRFKMAAGYGTTYKNDIAILEGVTSGSYIPYIMSNKQLTALNEALDTLAYGENSGNANLLNPNVFRNNLIKASATIYNTNGVVWGCDAVDWFKDDLSNVKFENNTQYTFIVYGRCKNATSTYVNLIIHYTDGTDSASARFEKTNTDSYGVIVSDSGKTIEKITFTWGTTGTYLYPDKCGVFKGVKNVSDFVPYIESNLQLTKDVTDLKADLDSHFKKMDIAHTTNDEIVIPMNKAMLLSVSTGSAINLYYVVNYNGTVMLNTIVNNIVDVSCSIGSGKVNISANGTWHKTSYVMI